MSDNYFFIDGSALTSQIRSLRKKDPSFDSRKLCAKKFIQYFMSTSYDLHGGSYKRATFYFPKGDEVSAEEYVKIPEFKRPGEVRDIHFKFCGEKLKKSAEFTSIIEEHIPEKFRSRVNKSEKGIDIEICCDGFRLAAASRMDRLFLLTNDDDFVPFCKIIKDYGSNVSIIHLSDWIAPNGSLLKEADSYDVVAKEALQAMFLPVPDPALPVQEVLVEAEPSPDLKQDAAPSDLIVDPLLTSDLAGVDIDEIEE